MKHFPPLLSDAPLGRHVCQFHCSARTLVDAVAGYVDVGLYRRDGVIVIATATNRASLLQRLAASGIDSASAIATGQFVLLDAEATLKQFMVDGSPDRRAFRNTIMPVLEQAIARGFRRLRAYGEMVNVLWHSGRAEAALELEALWNEVVAEFPMALFCGYEIDGLDPRTYHQPLDGVARLHTDMVASDDDDRLRSAVDAATNDILGLPLSSALTYFGKEGGDAEHRLPPGHRTLLWLSRNMPSAMVKVLNRARSYYATA